MATAAHEEKHFPGELSQDFGELIRQLQKTGPLTRTLPRTVIFLLRPFLGALPHQIKKDLEKAVASPFCFNTSGATGMNILLNMVLYPLLSMAVAAWIEGTFVLFTAQANTYALAGLVVAFVETAYRLRDGLFHLKPAEESVFPAAFYGVPLSYLLRPLLTYQAGIIRFSPIPVDGFYAKGFAEKIERERRYGNVYTLQDWGDAYFLRLEFPRKVPEIGLAARQQLPDEMPDYDYDLALKDGHFIIKGKCPDENVRKISSSVAAFPPEFTTVVPLREKVLGFSHRFGNKLLEVVLLKERGKNPGEPASL